MLEVEGVIKNSEKYDVNYNADDIADETASSSS